MGEQENVKVVQQLYADFGKGNIPAILNTLAEDVEWREPAAGPPPFAGTYRGRERVGEFFRKLRATRL